MTLLKNQTGKYKLCLLKEFLSGQEMTTILSLGQHAPPPLFLDNVLKKVVSSMDGIPTRVTVCTFPISSLHNPYTEYYTPPIKSPLCPSYSVP